MVIIQSRHDYAVVSTHHHCEENLMTVSLRSAKAVRSQITGAAESAKSQRDKIQAILVQCAGHAFAHGDVTLFEAIVTLGNGVNQKAIRDWAGAYGLCKMNNKGGAK